MSSIRRWIFVFITFHTFSIIFKSGLCGGHSKVGISFSVFHWFCNGLYQGRNYKTKFSVMFWGCISYYGVGTVVGNLNSEKYINILDDNLWSVNINFDRQNRFLFSRLTGEILVFLQTGCFLYLSKFKRLRTVLEEILVTNWRLSLLI
jgi:hypothetical protein